MEIGYLGPEDSYSHGAALAYCQLYPERRPVPYSSFYEIIQAIEEGQLQEAVLPIENSTEGAVTRVMDLLLETQKTLIQGELTLAIEHSLLGLGDPDQLKVVYSHPQAIEQCRLFFLKNYPQVELQPCQSTSKACELALEQGEVYGAIAHQSAEERYGLKVLHQRIQDNPHNQTRFLVVGRQVMGPTGHDKTSINFSFSDDYPGSLYLVLKLFAEQEINLTRIESRPAKRQLGNYTFYIDFAGHGQEEKVRQILEEIGAMANHLKVFGSYPRG